MFEDNMLMPNLDFNPEFDGKIEANLLSLEENGTEAAFEADYLMSLAQ
jgi:hypothetical protein